VTELSLASVVGRLLPSLALVVGGLLLVKWWSAKSRGGVAASIRVVARTGLSRAAQVAVVQVGTQHYLLGVTDTNVRLLAELPSNIDVSMAAAVDGAVFGVGAMDAPAMNAVTASTQGPRTGLVGRLRQATLRRDPTSPGLGAPRAPGV